mgnify:CR=1 FL=1
MPPNKSKKNRVTRDQQIKMGLVQEPIKGFRSAQALGLPTEPPPRPAAITRVEPAPPAKGYDWTMNDQPYHAQKNEHLDIAKGFRHVVVPVSIAASLAVPITAWVGLGVPVLSLVTLALMVGTFTVSYFSTWILSQFFSHYGVQLAKVILGYRLLRHDQRERHKHYRRLSR